MRRGGDCGCRRAGGGAVGGGVGGGEGRVKGPGGCIYIYGRVVYIAGTTVCLGVLVLGLRWLSDIYYI